MKRPRIDVTPEQRRQIEVMAGFGLSQEDVALVMGFSVDTLTKYCALEFKRGKVRASIQVVQSLYEMATGTGGQPRNVAAAIYWTKAQLGWREKAPEGPVAGGASYVLLIER